VSEERFRKALERIRDFKIKGPIDEWAQAAAFTAVQEIAADALSPGLIDARRRDERLLDRDHREKAKALRKQSSSGIRHFLPGSAPKQPAGFAVCVLNDKCERADLVWVKIERVIGKPLQPWRVGERLSCNLYNLKPLPEET
jgi:hypothetical protein